MPEMNMYGQGQGLRNEFFCGEAEQFSPLIFTKIIKFSLSKPLQFDEAAASHASPVPRPLVKVIIIPWY